LARSEDQIIVLNGLPGVKAEVTPDTTIRSQLDGSKPAEFRVIIAKQGADYAWVTRGDKPLIHRTSGAFHIFIDPTGSGYIKVVDRRMLFDDPPLAERYAYYEHIHMWLSTITYYGHSSVFNP